MIKSRVELWMRTARNLLHRIDGLLSYFDRGINKGQAEDIKNKIKVLTAVWISRPGMLQTQAYRLHKKQCQLEILSKVVFGNHEHILNPK